MANSSFNSSFSLSHVVSKDFEAFEELYKRSTPLPKLTKPSFGTRDHCMAPPPAAGHQGQSRLKIKALFDTMKERNSSMCSDLNSSICTSTTSCCDVDIVSRPAADFDRPREKENQVPIEEQDEVDFLTEITESPRHSERPPVPQSPAMRVALNFARHAAQVESVSASESSKTTAKLQENIHRALAAQTVASKGKALRGTGKQDFHKTDNEERTVSGVAGTASRDLCGEMSDADDIGPDCAENAETVTEEVCVPVCNNPKEGGSTDGTLPYSEGSPPALSTTVTLESAHSSPGSSNKSSDESQADQETLQLASKLMERLKSNTNNNDDEEDDWEPTSMPVPSRFKGRTAAKSKELSKATNLSKVDRKTRPRKAQNEKLGAGPCVLSTSNNRRNAASNSERNTKGKPRSSSNLGQEQEKIVVTRTLRSRKRRPADSNVSISDAQGESKAAKGKRKGSEKEDDSQKVEEDVVCQQVLRTGGDNQDPFSLEDSRDDNDLQVDEDAIAQATKKSRRLKPTTAKKKGVQDKGRSGGPTSRKKRAAGGDASGAKGDKAKVLKMTCWSLQPVARLKSVRIEGKLPNTDYFWLSSVIVERVSSRILKTTNGSLYQLVGTMTALHTRAAGFSAELTELFKKGFPEDWKELLESSVAAAELKSKALLSRTVPASRKENHLPNREKANVKTMQPNRGTPKKKPTKAVDASNFHTPVRTRNDEEPSSASTIWTPQGVMSRNLGTHEVRRTQSGRCVMPPLARWAGQYLQRDQNGNVTIGFASKAAEKHFAVIAEHELDVPNRLRNTPMSTKIRAGNTPSRQSPLCQQRRTAGRAAVSKKQVTKTTSSRCAVGNTGSRTNEGNLGAVVQDSCAADGENMEEATQEEPSLEEEVMSVVLKSKTRRCQKAPKKRATCYASAADGECRSTNWSESESLDKADKQLASIKNPNEAGIKPVSECAPNIAVTENKASKGQRKAPRAQPPTKPSTNPQKVKNAVGRARKKAALSASFDNGEDFEASTTIQSNLPSRRGRKKKQLEPATVSDSEDCHEGGNNDGSYLPGKIPSASPIPSTTVSTKATRRKRGPAKNMAVPKGSEESDPSNKTRKRGRPRGSKNVDSKKLSKENCEDLDREQTDKHFEEADPKSNRRGRSRTQVSKNGGSKKLSNKVCEDDDKELSVDESGDEESNNGNAKTQSRLKSTGRNKGRNAEKQTKGKSQIENCPASENNDGAQPWSKEEIEKFHRGMGSVSSNHPEFWEVVSQYVGTRSSKECAAFRLKDDAEDTDPTSRKAKVNKGSDPNGIGRSANPKKAQKQKTKQIDKTPVVCAKRGTLKRRREVTAILAHGSKANNPDDMFQGTPYRTKKTKRALLKSENEVFGAGINFITPTTSKSLAPGLRISHTPASSRKTPSIAIISPWDRPKDSAKKRDLDQYIYRQQKNKRQFTKSFKKKKSEETDSGSLGQTSVRLFEQSPVPEDLFKVTETPVHDQEDRDYYFSEDES